MKKKAFFLSFVLVLCVASSLFSSDSVTFVTYYPSPYGIYRELKAKKMVVGDVSQAAPTEDGVLQVDRSVLFKPYADVAAIQALSNAQVGELAYAQAEDTFVYQNGSGGATNGWVEQSGGGTSAKPVISKKCKAVAERADGFTAAVTNLSCSVTCPTGWTDVDFGCVVNELLYESGWYIAGGYCERWCIQN